LLESFKKQDGEIFGEHSPSGQNVTLHIDTSNSVVGVYTDDRDIKGRPV
jgi:hypothetical protein